MGKTKDIENLNVSEFHGLPSYRPDASFWENLASHETQDRYDSLLFEVAGVPLAVFGDRTLFSPEFAPFQVEAKSPAARHTFWFHEDTERKFYLNPSDYPDRGPSSEIIRTPDAPEAVKFYAAARFLWKENRTQVSIIRGVPEVTRQFMVSAFIKEVFSHMGLSWGLLFFHGTALEKNGEAFVCFGPSGVGKSTVSQFGHDNGFTVLNDEMIALRLEADGVKVYGTPIGSEFSSPGGIPVKAFFRLTQSEKDAAEIMPARERVFELTSSAQTGDLRYPELLTQSMDFLDKVMKFVPCYRMYFTKSPAFLKTAMKCICRD